MSRSRRIDAAPTGAIPKSPSASAAAATPAAPPASARTPATVSSAVWTLTTLLALLALVFACSGAPLGSAVADDYSFLAHLKFQNPLDWFDSMGATYYWRPVSRQLYFTLVGPWLLEAPWGAALLHALLISGLALLAFRIARRDLAAPVAATIAASIVLAEPARVLLGWPSGAQHLLAALFALLAVHEAQARRLPIAALAALAGLLSHESAALALPVILLVTWRDRRDLRALFLPAAMLAAVATVWAIGYRVALAHGVVTPPAHAPGVAPGNSLLGRLPDLYARAAPAALNLEDIHGIGRALVVAALIACAVVTAAIHARPAGRARLRAALPLSVTAALWFLAGVLPLAVLLPDWNGWRAWTPSLGIAIAIPALLGSASPWLAGVFVMLRLITLLMAPIAPPQVTAEPPVLGSHVSFAQLVRLQRIVVASREVMLRDVRDLKPYDHVFYWEIPLLAEFGFQGANALHVWYGDSTLAWSPFGGQKGLTTPYAAGIEYRFRGAPFAATINRNAIALFQQAAVYSNSGQLARSDSVLSECRVALGYDHGPFAGQIAYDMALNAYHAGRVAQADSLNEISARIGRVTPSYWLLRAACAEVRGDQATERVSVERSLALDPTNPFAIDLARKLGLIP